MKKKSSFPQTKVKNPEPKKKNENWIIWAAWADRITFEEIKEKSGKNESEVAKNFIPNTLIHYFIEKDKIIDINFPILESPSKPESLKLKNDQVIKGVLKGIKGQYLIFEENKVLNVRAHEGYLIQISL